MSALEDGPMWDDMRGRQSDGFARPRPKRSDCVCDAAWHVVGARWARCSCGRAKNLQRDWCMVLQRQYSVQDKTIPTPAVSQAVGCAGLPLWLPAMAALRSRLQCQRGVPCFTMYVILHHPFIRRDARLGLAWASRQHGRAFFH